MYKDKKEKLLQEIENFNKEIEKYDEEIEKSKKKIISLKQKYRNQSQKSRRERARHLILVGALLEMAGIDEEDPATLLGYFLQYKYSSDTDLDKYQFQGFEVMKERNEEKEKRRLQRKFEKDEAKLRKINKN